MIVTISRGFKTLDGRGGVVATDIQIDHLIEFISSIEVCEDSYAFLMDSEGNIITHKNDEFKPTEDESKKVEDILDGKLKNIMDKDDVERLKIMTMEIDYFSLEI